MQLSSRTRLTCCNPEAWELHGVAMAARARGEDSIVLTIGDPDRDSPGEAIRAAVGALQSQDTHYTDSRGRMSLRAAVAARHAALWGLGTRAEMVTVTSGAQGGLFAACMCLFGPGDEVLVPDPSYVSYAPVLHAAGAMPVAVPTGPGLRIDASALRSAAGPRTKGIVYADPANPTGTVMRSGELEAVARVAVDYGLWVVSDEIYSRLAWGAEFRTIQSLPGMEERTVVVDGLAKSHAMTGWRLGWTIASPATADAIGHMASIMQHGLPGFVQEGGLAAIRHCDGAVEGMRLTCRRRAALVCRMLEGSPGIRCTMPDAGMFVLARVDLPGITAGQFAWDLWHRTGVAVMDGSAFGASTQGYVRLSLAVGDAQLGEACRRIAAYLQTRCRQAG